MIKNKSKYAKQRGVYKCGQKFKSQIQVDGKQEYLGIFDTREQAAQAYDIRALQFGRTDHLNYNTRGGHAQFQQDHSRLLSKRVLGASVIELDVAQQRLVRIIVKLARGSNNVKSDSANAESEICVDAEREDLIREAEDLVKAADDAHNRVHTCLEMLLLV